MIKLIIFGSGDHSKVILSEVLKYNKFKFLGFVDDKRKKGELVTSIGKKKYYNLGSISNFIKKKNDFRGIIGIGLNFLREKIYLEILNKDKKFKFQKIISKDSIINKNVSIGDGSLIVSGSTINFGTTIGKHCIINTSCSIDHDNYFHDFSSAGPATITGGRVTLGSFSHLGINSTIRQNIKISEKTIIGAKSYVNKDCKKNLIYFGSPAKKIRSRLKNDNYF